MGTNMQDIQFLSTLSLRRATIPFVQFLLHTPISIHALLAESDQLTRNVERSEAISIHALLAESDHTPRRPVVQRVYFYPRSPCGERPERLIGTVKLDEFLSTLSLRRATLRVVDGSKSSIISIHALLAESDLKVFSIFLPIQISIHALLAESDPPVRDIIQWEGIFLSTLSLRRATYLINTYHRIFGISIHALLAESDYWPCVYVVGRPISIHALLAESDQLYDTYAKVLRVFLSTLSLRRATLTRYQH